MKSFLSENNINVRHVRLDIVSHEIAIYKSFRFIAPGHYGSQLMSIVYRILANKCSSFRVWATNIHENEYTKWYGQKESVNRELL